MPGEGLQQSKLHQAARSGNAMEVARLLAAGADNNVLISQETALHLAAVRGHTRVVRTLLAAGASPLLAEPEGLLPIHVAAAAGHLAATRLLLAAAPHTAAVVDTGGRTPLYLAAHFGSLPAVRLLLEAAPQAARMKTQRDNESPLFVAASSGHEAVVRVLLEAAPEAALEVSHLSAGGLTPLLAACLRGNAAVVRQLLAAVPQAATSQAAPVPAIHAAVRQGRLEIVRLILEAVPQAALVPTFNGLLPLHTAASAGELPSSGPIAQLLLAAAPATAMAAVEGDRCTPLHLAALRGNASVAAALVHAASGAACMQTDLHQRTPVAVALAMAAEAAEQADGGEVGNGAQLRPVAAYLDTARPMLAVMLPDTSLPLLAQFVHVALPLFPTVAAHWPLTAAQWQQVPGPCPGLGSALPAALQRSEAEAALLVARLPAADSARLRAFALALRRSQRQLGIFLPGEHVGRILSLFDA